MLININPILNPELLYHLRAMGHGDKLVLTDANFPAYSHSLNNKVIRLDGVNIYEAAKAILSVFPLDSFIASAAERMQVDNKPEELTECHKDFIKKKFLHGQAVCLGVVIGCMMHQKKRR